MAAGTTARASEESSGHSLPGRLRALRAFGTRLTTPLLPDDYLHLINPLWSARELRGKVVKVEPETDDAATLVIKPGWGFSFDYEPGQYVGIGVDLDGRFQWRSYSLTSPPKRSQGHIAVTVKAMPEGLLSEHLVRGLEPGTVVRLAVPQGSFVLPDPPPPRLLFLTAGSGITPIIAMLRTLDRRGTMPDVVVVHSAPSPTEVLFGGELRGLSEGHDSVRLHEQHTAIDGRLDLGDLDRIVPDWRERQTWACGPSALLDEAEQLWQHAGLDTALHLERFSATRSASGEGGLVRFTQSDREAQVDGATTLLEAAEGVGVALPFGCRMGICHTCVLPLASGMARDLRTGELRHENEKVQTCVSAPEGDCSLAR